MLRLLILITALLLAATGSSEPLLLWHDNGPLTHRQARGRLVEQVARDDGEVELTRRYDVRGLLVEESGYGTTLNDGPPHLPWRASTTKPES